MLWLAQQASLPSDRAWVAPLDAGPAMGAMEALVAVDMVAGAEATGTSAAAVGPAKHSTASVHG